MKVNPYAFVMGREVDEVDIKTSSEDNKSQSPSF